MAERRMFAKSIIDSDLFLDLSMSARLLYYDLGMRADDDGFVNNPKHIQRFIGASDDDLKVLIAKGLIIPFANGVVVIAHWQIHNYIRKDSYKETHYREQKKLLEYDESGAYRLINSCDVTTNAKACNNKSEKSLQQIENVVTQDRIGKDRIGKDSIDKNNNEQKLISEFDELWQLYPKKQGKTNAFKAYKKARTRKNNPVTFEQVRNGIDGYNFYIKKKNIEQKYIKQGSTWFNQECWNDDYTVIVNNNNDSNNYAF